MKENYEEKLIKLEENFAIMQEKIELLKSSKHLYYYFKKVEKRNNSYMATMRNIIAKDLFKKGMHKVDIAAILCRDHASILHLFTKYAPEDSITEEVQKNYLNWIRDGVYPHTYQKTINSEEDGKKSKAILIYKLKKI